MGSSWSCLPDSSVIAYAELSEYHVSTYWTTLIDLYMTLCSFWNCLFVARIKRVSQSCSRLHWSWSFCSDCYELQLLGIFGAGMSGSSLLYVHIIVHHGYKSGTKNDKTSPLVYVSVCRKKKIRAQFATKKYSAAWFSAKNSGAQFAAKIKARAQFAGAQFA